MHIKIFKHGACKSTCDYVARKPKDGEQVTTLWVNFVVLHVGKDGTSHTHLAI